MPAGAQPCSLSTEPMNCGVVPRQGRQEDWRWVLTLLLAIGGLSTGRVDALAQLVGPTITAQPQSRTNLVGSLASFSVSANGTSPLHYQWFLNRTNRLGGATAATLDLPNVQKTNAGSYTV